MVAVFFGLALELVFGLADTFVLLAEVSEFLERAEPLEDAERAEGADIFLDAVLDFEDVLLVGDCSFFNDIVGIVGIVGVVGVGVSVAMFSIPLIIYFFVDAEDVVDESWVELENFSRPLIIVSKTIS